MQDGRCDDECRRHLYDTRQVRLALDREMNRVQRVFIGAGDCCDLKELLAAHSDLIAIRASPADEPLLALLPERYTPLWSSHFTLTRIAMLFPHRGDYRSIKPKYRTKR